MLLLLLYVMHFLVVRYYVPGVGSGRPERNGVHCIPMASPQPGTTPPNAIHVTMATSWMPLGLTALSALVFPLDGTMTACALPFIADEFAASPAGAGWVSVGLQFMILGLALPIGSLATSLGRRRLFTIGLGVFVLGLIGSYLSPNLPALIGARVVQGLGCALFLSTRNAIGMEGFPPARRGMALGIIIAAVGLGAGSGPLIGGQLIDVFGWRSVYVAVAPLALLGSTHPPAAPSQLRRPPRRRPHRRTVCIHMPQP